MRNGRGKFTAAERAKLIWAIVHRDGNQCWLCKEPFGKKVGKGPCTIDHAIPKARGGTNQLRNLRVAHAQCNHERGMIVQTKPRASRLHAEAAGITISKSKEPADFERAA